MWLRVMLLKDIDPLVDLKWSKMLSFNYYEFMDILIKILFYLHLLCIFINGLLVHYAD